MHAAPGRPPLGRACARSTPRRRRRSASTRRPASTSASAAARRATSSRSCGRSSTSTSWAPWSGWRPGPASSCATRRRARARSRQRRTRLVEAMGKAVEWYHERLLDGARRPAGPRLPAHAGHQRRRRRAGTSSAGRPTTGTRWSALRLPDDVAARHRPRLPQPPRPAAGRLPRPGAVPDLRRRRRRRWRSAGGSCRAATSREVQELAGDARSTQEQDALRTQLGQGRHRARATRSWCARATPTSSASPQAGVPRAVATCGTALTEEHVPAAEALRPAGRAGLRRRRGRAGRGRAVLRVGRRSSSGTERERRLRGRRRQAR